MTVVQSTVTVEPLPWTDSAANDGTPFVIQVHGASLSTKRQEQVPSWLTANGNTTTDGSKATRYLIRDGQLSSANGGSYLSTTANVPYGPMALSSNLGTISITFSIKGGALNWTNSAFVDGVARFFKTPANAVNNVEILARFNGPIDSAWTPVLLFAVPGTLEMGHATVFCR